MRDQADVSAFSEFVSTRSARLFRTAYLVIGDHQLAQDLVQDALVRTYVAWPRLRERENAEAYTRRVIVTTAISWRRRRSFHEQATGTLPDLASVDETAWIGARDELWRALRLLPPRQRASVVLRFCEDLSEAETAALVGCSVGTVKRQVHLALGKLRDQLAADVVRPDRTAVTP